MVLQDKLHTRTQFAVNTKCVKILDTEYFKLSKFKSVTKRFIKPMLPHADYTCAMTQRLTVRKLHVETDGIAVEM